MNHQVVDKIKTTYLRQGNIADKLEQLQKRMREELIGFNYSIFDATIRYYRDVKGELISHQDALARALSKEMHKSAWYKSERKSLDEIMHFYQEVDIYPFRQPYNYRLGGFRYLKELVWHKKSPLVLEYGCGSAVLTEYLLARYPELTYTVADIPSTTLEFVKWKKKTYEYPYAILTIGKGKNGIPLKSYYDLIICKDVLEHTPNPLEITSAFCDYLAPGGVLVIDFINAPGGENLQQAVDEREEVKKILRDRLIALKAIDMPQGNDGLYMKDFQ